MSLQKRQAADLEDLRAVVKATEEQTKSMERRWQDLNEEFWSYKAKASAALRTTSGTHEAVAADAEVQKLRERVEVLLGDLTASRSNTAAAQNRVAEVDAERAELERKLGKVLRKQNASDGSAEKMRCEHLEAELDGLKAQFREQQLATEAISEVRADMEHERQLRLHIEAELQRLVISRSFHADRSGREAGPIADSQPQNDPVASSEIVPQDRSHANGQSRTASMDSSDSGAPPLIAPVADAKQWRARAEAARKELMDVRAEKDQALAQVTHLREQLRSAETAVALCDGSEKKIQLDYLRNILVSYCAKTAVGDSQQEQLMTVLLTGFGVEAAKVKDIMSKRPRSIFAWV